VETVERIIFFSTSLARASAIQSDSLVGIKGAIEQLARELAKDLSAHGITVDNVATGLSIQRPSVRASPWR
jgi:NAD(P)-dependent dehydrogenase (short-subunit alcohol dehydrogenase family)